jgi:hypothetical protein
MVQDLMLGSTLLDGKDEIDEKMIFNVWWQSGRQRKAGRSKETRGARRSCSPLEFDWELSRSIDFCNILFRGHRY